MSKRGKIEFEIDVQNKRVAQTIKDRIEDGIEKALRRNLTNSVPDAGVDAARSKIREEGAVWRGELIENFDVRTKKSGGKWFIIIENDSDHAKPLDEGAEYDEEGPPIEKLIPWVQSNLGGFDGDASAVFGNDG